MQQFQEVPGEVPDCRYVIHDPDSIFSPSLDSALIDFEVRVLRTPLRTPIATAFCERLAGTLRRECLNYVIPAK